jgi:hypothetical protein
VPELHPTVRTYIDQRRLGLWLGAECDSSTLQEALTVPWSVIWSEISTESLRRSLQSVRDVSVVVVGSVAEAPPGKHDGQIVYIFDTSVGNLGTPTDLTRKQRHAEALENKVEGWDGLLVCVGAGPRSIRWQNLVAALAPTAPLLLVADETSNPTDLPTLATKWDSSAIELFSLMVRHRAEMARSDLLDLKDAKGISIDANKVLAVSDGWELLTRGHIIAPSIVTQTDFDAFLSGDPAWIAVRAGAAYLRGKICSFSTKETQSRVDGVDAIEFVRNRMRDLDQREPDPFETLDQVLLFSEPGSGCTTTLKQIALAIARDGYPTLVTRPDPRDLTLDSLQNLIVEIQERWAVARVGSGSGTGSLPVCLVLDTDTELSAPAGGGKRHHRCALCL